MNNYKMDDKEIIRAEQELEELIDNQTILFFLFQSTLFDDWKSSENDIWDSY